MRVFDHHADTFIPLECKNYVKYLGVFIDESLSWKHHIPHIASSIIVPVGIISRLRHFVTFSTLRHIFVSSNLLPLDFLSFKSSAVLMHHVFNDLTPLYITNMFNYQANIHSYKTRSSTRGNIFVKYSRLNPHLNLFLDIACGFGTA